MTEAFRDRIDISLTVNGEPVEGRVPAGRHLIDFLRLDLGLTGSHAGCEHGVCGACTITVDGQAVRGCLILAAQADGAEVWTLEGLTESGVIRDLQEAFVARNALQCGYLHAGDAGLDRGIAGHGRRAGPGRDPRASVGQLLPLHRV